MVRLLALGAAVFAIHGLLGSTPDASETRRIDIPAGMVRGVSEEIRQRTGRPATPLEVDDAVRRYVESEVLYREARARNLDRGDPVVRRRLIQKMRFVIEDTAEVQTPDERELRAFFDSDPGRFEQPAATSLEHLFFSFEHRGTNARHDAQTALARLLETPEAATQLRHDPFLWGDRLERTTDTRLEEIFGSGFPQGIATLPAGVWQGPLRSTYGYHLVRILSREPARVPDFAEASEAVYRAYRETHRERAEQAALDEFVSDYEIVLPESERQIAELKR